MAAEDTVHSPSDEAVDGVPTRREAPGRPVALLAIGCAATSLISVVLALLPVPALAFGAPPLAWYSGVLALLHLGQVAGVLALAGSGLQGQGALGRFGSGLGVLGGLLLGAGELLYPADLAVSDVAFGLGSCGAGVGMTLAGAAVLRERRWTGAGRFLPLAIGLYVFLLLMPALVAGRGELLAIAGWSGLWLLLGVSLSVGRTAVDGTDLRHVFVQAARSAAPRTKEIR